MECYKHIKQVINRDCPYLFKILSSGFGTGYIPIASGTWSSAAAALIYWYIFPDNPFIAAAITITFILLSIPLCTKAEAVWSNKDDRHIVLDEFAGMWISVLFLPKTLPFIIAGFFLFRLFDIWKPLGIRKSQKLQGGLGVMADDVLAGVLANIILRGTGYFLEVL